MYTVAIKVCIKYQIQLSNCFIINFLLKYIFYGILDNKNGKYRVNLFFHTGFYILYNQMEKNLFL